MKKALLANLPLKSASNNLLGMARKSAGSINIIASIEKVDMNIIALSAYTTQDLLAGIREPFLRAFFQKNPNELIKQFRTEDGKWKWVDKKMQNIETYYANSGRLSMDSTRSLKLSRSFFNCDPDASSITRAIYSFEDEIYRVRRMERHKAEHRLIEQTMNEEFSKKIPKSFHDWTKKNAFTPYLFYRKNKSTYQCKCSFCKKETLVSEKTLKLRHKSITHCPSCHHEAVAFSEGRIKYALWEERNIAYLTENSDMSLRIRYINYSRRIHPSTFDEPTFHFYEGLRTIHKGSYYKRYEHYQRYNNFLDWWESPENGQRIAYSSMIHKSGLELYGTCLLYPTKLTGCLKYSGIDYINSDKLSIQKPFDLESMIAKYEDNPVGVEKVLKSGYKKLIEELEQSTWYSRFSYEATTLYDITGLSKSSYRFARDNDLSSFEVKLIRLLDNLGQKYSAEDVKFWGLIDKRLLDQKWDRFSSLMETASFRSFISFLRKGLEGIRKSLPRKPDSYSYSPLESLYIDYFDYLKAIQELKYVTTDKYYLFPKDFKEAHDRITAELQAKRDKISAEKKRREAQLVADRLEEAKKILEFNEDDESGSFKSKDYVICVPQSAEEIREEGKQMHHCVGTYVPRVARGETCIFFVRRLKEPDKSFCTLEWNNGIVQCRAAHNDDPSDDVLSFVRAFDMRLKQKGITTAKLAGFTASLKENIAV